MSEYAPQPVSIRDLGSIDELFQLKAVEKEVWKMDDEDAIPLTLAIALKAAGNIFIGAFTPGSCETAKPAQERPGKESNGKGKAGGERMVGFAFGFLGREQGVTTIHSHMLAVVDGYRHLDLGARLKHAQRERALAMG